MVTKKAVLGVNNLVKMYGQRQIFDNASVAFNQDKISFLMAPNGFGKTTLMRILSDLERANHGDVSNPFKHGESFTIFDDLSLYKQLSGLDNIRIFTNFKFDDSRIRDVSDRYLTHERLRHKVKSYSLGEGKKVSLIIWELLKPKLVIMDEITNGLDYDSLRELRSSLVLHKQENFTILTGHHFEFYEEIVDDLYIILDKQIQRVSDWRKEGMATVYEKYFSPRDVVRL